MFWLCTTWESLFKHQKVCVKSKRVPASVVSSLCALLLWAAGLRLYLKTLVCPSSRTSPSEVRCVRALCLHAVFLKMYVSLSFPRRATGRTRHCVVDVLRVWFLNVYFLSFKFTVTIIWEDVSVAFPPEITNISSFWWINIEYQTNISVKCTFHWAGETGGNAALEFRTECLILLVLHFLFLYQMYHVLNDLD